MEDRFTGNQMKHTGQEQARSEVGRQAERRCRRVMHGTEDNLGVRVLGTGA